MRADRLVATLLLLQQQGRVTAAEVAAEMEVSIPTARRDLEALSAAGVPVFAQPGRGGGWELVGGARTDLSGLTSEEAQAVFLLVGAATGRPQSPALTGALRKLTQALPAPFRESAQAAASALLVDDSPWGAMPLAEPPAHLETLRSAVIERRRVEVSYVDRAGRASVRLLDPWRLVVKDGTWYAVAGTARGRRTLRVDRIVEARVTDAAADPPPTDPARRPGRRRSTRSRPGAGRSRRRCWSTGAGGVRSSGTSADTYGPPSLRPTRRHPPLSSTDRSRRSSRRTP